MAELPRVAEVVAAQLAPAAEVVRPAFAVEAAQVAALALEAVAEAPDD